MPWLVIRYRIKRFSLLGNENLYLQQLEMHGWRYYILALFISIFPITTAHGCRQRWISWSEHNRLPAAVLPATFTVRKWFFLHQKLHLRLPGQEETFRPNTKNLSWSSLELSFESMEEISFFFHDLYMDCWRNLSSEPLFMFFSVSEWVVLHKSLP